MTSPISKKQKLLRPRDSDDVIEDILSRLPVKSLKRFQLVNKSWEALISHQDFVEKHLCQMKKNNSANFQILLQMLSPHSQSVPKFEGSHRIFKPLPRTRRLRSVDYKASLKFLKEGDDAAPVALRELELEYYTDLNMDPDDASMVIFGSVNGLICYEFNQIDLVLWNPSTTESKLLPRATFADDKHGLAFYGFGYDDKTKDYKVVRGSYNVEYTGNEMLEQRNCNFVEVFSLKRGSWSIDVNCDILGIDGQGCLVNETLYWIDRRNEVVLRSFDLGEEKFSKSVQPLSSIMRERNTFIMGVFNVDDCVAVYAINFSKNWEISTKAYIIWVRKNLGVHDDSWTKVAHVITDEFFFKPIWVSECGAILAVVNCVVAWYDPKENVVKQVIGFDRRFHATKYGETLVSPWIGNIKGESSGMAMTINTQKEEGV